jgi:hypothetical protein
VASRTLTITIAGDASGAKRAVDDVEDALDDLDGKTTSVGVNLAANFSGGLVRGIADQIGQIPGQIDKALAQAVLANPVVGVAIIAGISAGILGSIPALATVLVGGLAASIAGLSLGIGVLVQAQTPEVKAAASELGSTISDGMLKATAPLQGPIIRSLEIFGETFERLEPQILDLFEALAPAVEPLAQALADMVEGAMPGFVAMVEALVPIVPELAPAFGDLGMVVGDFLTALADNPGTMEAFKQFLLIVVVLIAGFIRSLELILPALTGFFLLGNRVARGVLGAFSGMGSGAGSALRRIGGAAMAAAGTVGRFAVSVGSAVGRVAGAVAGVATRMAGGFGRMASAASGAAGRMASAFAAGGGRMVGAVSGAVSRVVGVVLGLGSRLWSAGYSAVSRLADGIRAAIGLVSSAIGSVTRTIGRYLPGSPVREGPLTVLNRGYAGAQIVRMLARGIDSESGSVATSIAAAVSPTPPSPVAAPGASRAPVRLVFQSDGTAVGDLIVEIVRRGVRVRGGNVQVALGA